MKMRWHHLVTYATSRCLPPPQPQSMSTPLSHFLVDCCLSPSSWLTTTIIVVISILNPSPPPSPSIVVRSSSFFTHFPSRPMSPSYLHRILFDCCVLTVVVVVWLPCLSFDSSSFSMEPPPPRPSSSHSRLPLPPRSHLFLPP